MIRRTTARHPQQTGFTLLEVVTAVFILSITMTALISWATQSADRTGLLREKLIANWVAHNRLTELHLQDSWPDTGNSNGESEMSGQTWPWRLEVKDTPDENIRRIDVFVDSPNGRGQLITLSGFLAPTPLSSGSALSPARRETGLGEGDENPDGDGDQDGDQDLSGDQSRDTNQGQGNPDTGSPNDGNDGSDNDGRFPGV